MSQVLLIDDNPTQLRVREAILRTAGIVVSVATTVESAVALMRSDNSHFGAVITDHLLEGQTGADFVRELRTFNETIPVVVLTGMPGIDEEYEGLNARVRQKPLPPDELISLVRNVLDHHQG